VTDRGYTATLEGFIARFDDLATKLREAHNADDETEVGELIDDLCDETVRAGEFIEERRKR
jgi:C4-type Zn-finger protein